MDRPSDPGVTTVLAASFENQKFRIGSKNLIYKCTDVVVRSVPTLPIPRWFGWERAKAGPRPGLQHGGGQVDPHGQIGGPPPQAGAWANPRPFPISVKENKGVAWGEGEG